MLYKSSAFDDRKQIFKDYHTLIVKVKNKPDLTGLKVMLLDDSKDLIDLALTNHTNIIYFNNKFYVITNTYVYIYTL